MLGEKLKELRENKGLVQRKIAAELDVDTAYVSKIESNEKSISRAHLKKLSAILGFPEGDLETLWLADKIYDLVKDESTGLKSIEVVHALLRKEVKAQPLVKAK